MVRIMSLSKTSCVLHKLVLNTNRNKFDSYIYTCLSNQIKPNFKKNNCLSLNKSTFNQCWNHILFKKFKRIEMVFVTRSYLAMTFLIDFLSEQIHQFINLK